MRVRLIKRKTLENFSSQYASSRNSFRQWLYAIRIADWNEPGDICETFTSADLLGGGTNRVVFDLGGNNYRIICKYQFGVTKIHLSIKWIGTHAEYTKLCKRGNQYTVNDF